MKELLKLKLFAAVQSEKAYTKMKQFDKDDLLSEAAAMYERSKAFSEVVSEAEKLLKNSTEASTENRHHFANTALAAVPQVNEVTNLEEPAGDSTVQQGPVSRQEVAKEVLLAFITEVENEFKDQNLEYLHFIAERVLGKQA